MTTLKAIELAIQGGYKGEKPESLIDPACLLSPNWWQALGKVLWWKDEECTDPQACCFEHYQGWQYKMHCFIDHLAEGKSIEDFFNSLEEPK